MKNNIKKFMTLILHPKVIPLKHRIPSYILGIPFAFLLLRFYYEFSLVFSIAFTVVIFICLSLSVFFELKTLEDDDELKASLESGEYYLNEKWQEKYAKYLRKHDFERIKGTSMKSDLNRRFLKKSGVIMIVFGALMLLTAIIIRTGLIETNVFFTVGGLIFAGRGMKKVLNTPVKKFIIDCGENLSDIERSYLNGKMLSYRKNGEHACNSGINIGSEYIVIYNNNKITAIKNSDIYFVCRYVLKTKYYGNSVYTGSVYTYSLSITLKIDEQHPNIRSYSADMNEFQVEMAYHAITPYATVWELEQEVQSDVYS